MRAVFYITFFALVAKLLLIPLLPGVIWVIINLPPEKNDLPGVWGLASQMRRKFAEMLSVLLTGHMPSNPEIGRRLISTGVVLVTLGMSMFLLRELADGALSRASLLSSLGVSSLFDLSPVDIDHVVANIQNAALVGWLAILSYLCVGVFVLYHFAARLELRLKPPWNGNDGGTDDKRGGESGGEQQQRVPDVPPNTPNPQPPTGDRNEDTRELAGSPEPRSPSGETTPRTGLPTMTWTVCEIPKKATGIAYYASQNAKPKRYTRRKTWQVSCKCISVIRAGLEIWATDCDEIPHWHGDQSDPCYRIEWKDTYYSLKGRISQKYYGTRIILPDLVSDPLMLKDGDRIKFRLVTYRIRIA